MNGIEELWESKRSRSTSISPFSRSTGGAARATGHTGAGRVFALAAGLRIGSGDLAALDFDAGTVELRGTVVQVKARDLGRCGPRGNRNHNPWIKRGRHAPETALDLHR